MSQHLSSQQTGDPVCHIWNKTLQIHSLNFWVRFSICTVNVYLSLWETPSDWECLEHSGGVKGCESRCLDSLHGQVLATVRWSLWGFDVCLSCVSFLLSVSFRHTVPTWLCMEFYKVSVKPSWTLCTLFIDALWLWSCWLCSQWLYYLIFFFSIYFSFGFIVSVVLLCCDKPIWCQQCFYLFYFSCNKKKSFSCSVFMDSTIFLYFLRKTTVCWKRQLKVKPQRRVLTSFKY